jgi:hypothetical protein
MIALLPAQVSAEASGAMLYATGTVWLNNGPLPGSSAIFPADLIRTETNSMAKFTAARASVIIGSESIVKYEGPAVALQHGSVSVATSSGMAVHALEVTVAPVSTAWTEFEVNDVDGTVRIMARKGEVNVTCGKDTVILPEGQQTTREELGKCRRKKAGADPAVSGDTLANRYFLLAAPVALCVFWFCSSSSSPSPSLSPSQP